jgi:hypothetical protein
MIPQHMGADDCGLVVLDNMELLVLLHQMEDVGIVLLHTSPILTIIDENFMHMKLLTKSSGGFLWWRWWWWCCG